MRQLSRFTWWLFTAERPARPVEYVLFFALPTLFLAGLVALSWPWLTEEAPGLIAAGFSVVQTSLSEWLRQLQALVPRFD